MFRFLSIFIVSFASPTFAQISFLNTSLSNPKLNILYIGVENIIEITDLKYDSTLKLESAFGQVIAFNNKFKVTHSSVTLDTLYLYRSNKLLLSKAYEVKKTGKPYAVLANISDTIASLKEILVDPKININIPNCYYDHGFRVYRFNVQIKNSKDEQILGPDTIQNNLLPKYVIKEIRKLESGDKIYLTNIVATCRGCILSLFKDIILIIK